MKKQMFKCIVFILCICSCKCDLDTVKKYHLKYHSGYYLGDVLIFDSRNHVINEKYEIFVNNKKVGVLLHCGWDKMEIQSLNGEKGIYLKHKLK